MKKIKFRAWDKTMNMMIYQGDTEFEFRLTGKGIEVDDLTFVDTAFNEKHEDIDCEVMQYTGLKDKNGVEIYEGDIVKTVYKTGYIKYCQKQGRYNIYLKSEFGLNEMNFMRNMADECGVIGNIYENPDLLEVKHETRL